MNYSSLLFVVLIISTDVCAETPKQRTRKRREAPEYVEETTSTPEQLKLVSGLPPAQRRQIKEIVTEARAHQEETTSDATTFSFKICTNNSCMAVHAMPYEHDQCDKCQAPLTFSHHQPKSMAQRKACIS